MTAAGKTRPERVIQFGEGGFLRGFADWMLQKMSDAGVFDGSVVVVQPIPEGMCDVLTAQNCQYTHLIRGAEGVEKTVVRVISRCVQPYRDWNAFLALADQPELRFVISNTTEAGIAFSDTDRPDDAPPATFPAKLTCLLYRRFAAGLPGFIFLPCELIDRNGDRLRETMLRYAELWSLGADFAEWIRRENVFCCTLVDRINTGFPRDEVIDPACTDKMLNTSEYFHLWVIETDFDLEKELPFSHAGLNVLITRDQLEVYRTRKVRILNGAHTSLVPHALLSGFDTVKSCMDDPSMREHLRKCVYDEIIPTLDLPRQELISYADDVLTRFENPYIRHYLSSIALNSVSKFRVRVLPSILEYRRRFGNWPPTLLFSFARLIEFYRTGSPNDDPEIVRFLRTASVDELLAADTCWGTDLSCLRDALRPWLP